MTKTKGRRTSVSPPKKTTNKKTKMQMRKKLFSMLVLLCAIVQGTWAQDEWATVYKQTQTTATNWTALDAGSTTGQTLGSAGTTTYYYVNSNLTFTRSPTAALAAAD